MKRKVCETQNVSPSMSFTIVRLPLNSSFCCPFKARMKRKEDNKNKKIREEKKKAKV